MEFMDVMNLYIRRLFMKCRIIKNKRILAGIVILGILLIGGVVISQAAEDEYRVHHNITIDLDGGVCDGIYYQSQIDHGPNQGQWRDDLGTGLYLSDRNGVYHTILDYHASIPKENATTSNYYDCVGITPYVRVGTVSKDGYILTGWEVTGGDGDYDDYGVDGVRVNIGAFADENIVIKAIWERYSFVVHYDAGVAKDRGISTIYIPEDEKAYYDRGDELKGLNEQAEASNGLMFAGWSFDRYGDSGIIKPEDIREYNEDVTIYAIWNYVITFDNNTVTEVNGHMDDITARLGSRLRLTGSNLSRIGYYLSGWNTKSDDSGQFYTTMSVVDLTPDDSGKAVLYAIWQPIFYEVHLYNNRPDEASEDIHVVDNGEWDWYEDEGFYSRFYTYDEIDHLPVVKDVYTLTGWTGYGWGMEDGTYIEGGADGKFNLADKLGKIVDVYVVWKENIYNINIDSNGGYESDTTIITGYEKENELPDAPERPGYDFDSWNTVEDGSGKNYKDKDTVSKLVEEDGGNVTIYAQWKKKKKLCLKVSSNIYQKSFVNPLAATFAKSWFGNNQDKSVGNMMAIQNKDCVQVWNVNRTGITRTR